MSDFRDTTEARALCRAARSGGDGSVDAGLVLEALDHAERLLDDCDVAFYQRECHRLRVEAERLRAAVRGHLGAEARHWTDAELIEALRELGGEQS